MKVLLNDNVLAGDGKESVCDFMCDGSPILQERMAFRGRQPKWFDRDNISHTISFTVYRTHNSVPECVMYVLKHMSKLRNQVTGLVSFVENYGAASAACYAEFGSLQSVKTGYKGKMSMISYQLKVGLITDDKPSTTP